jgi:hypothetical protein
MSTIGRLLEFQEDSSQINVAIPVIAPERAKALRVLDHGKSAIEYIVDTAEPGEVIIVDEADYYNPYLWRTYGDFST